MAGKRITVDHLAAIVADGFQALNDEMREGFRHVTGRLDSVEVTLAEHGTILAEHSTILKQHSGLLGRIERKLDSTIARVDDHGVRLEALERKKHS